MNTTAATFEARTLISTFVDRMAERYESYIRKNFEFVDLHRATHTVDVGKRYAKVIRRVGGSGSVVAFIDLEDGSIFKPASHRAPAKGVRANVRDEDNGISCLTTIATVCYAR